jgi:hypothetical protein
MALCITLSARVSSIDDVPYKRIEWETGLAPRRSDRNPGGCDRDDGRGTMPPSRQLFSGDMPHLPSEPPGG